MTSWRVRAIWVFGLVNVLVASLVSAQPAGPITPGEVFRTPWDPASVPAPRPPVETFVGPNPKLLARVGRDFYFNRGAIVVGCVPRTPSGQSVGVYQYLVDAPAETCGELTPGLVENPAKWPLNNSQSYFGNFVPVAVAVSVNAVEGASTIFVAACGPGPGTGRDIYTLAFSASGQLLWKARYDYAGSDDTPVAIVYGHESVFVACTCDTGSVGETDIVVLRYSATTGGGLAESPYHVEVFDNKRSERAVDMLNLDAALRGGTEGFTHLFVLGTSTDELGNADFLTVAYKLRVSDQALDTEWIDYYDGGGEDIAVSMSTNHHSPPYIEGTPTPGDTIYVCGSSEGLHGERFDADYLALAYDATTGTRVWGAPARWDGGYGPDVPRRIWAYGSAVGNVPGQFVYPKNYVYVTGGSWRGANGYDSATIAINVDQNLGCIVDVDPGCSSGASAAWPYIVGGEFDDFGVDVVSLAGPSIIEDQDGVLDPDASGVYVLSSLQDGTTTSSSMHVARLNRFLSAGRTSQPVWQHYIDTFASDWSMRLLIQRRWVGVPDDSEQVWNKDLSDLYVLGQSVGGDFLVVNTMTTVRIQQCYDATCSQDCAP